MNSCDPGRWRSADEGDTAMTKTPRRMKHFPCLLAALLLALPATASDGLAADRATAEQLEAIQKYIKQGWRTLTRSNAQLANAAVDPKFKLPAGARWPVYVPRRENLKRIEQTLRAEMSPEDFARSNCASCRTTRARYANRACSICPTLTSCPADASTRCTAGTVTSFRSGCCATARSRLPGIWSRTFSTRSSTTARF